MQYSSCRPSDPLLAPNPWYDDLAAEPPRRQQLWRAFLLEQDPKEAVVRQAAWVVGGDGKTGDERGWRGCRSSCKRGEASRKRTGKNACTTQAVAKRGQTAVSTQRAQKKMVASWIWDTDVSPHFAQVTNG